MLKAGILVSLEIKSAFRWMSTVVSEFRGYLIKGGYEKINNLAISIPESLQRNRELLDEAKRILTEEAQSDQELRTKFGPKWTRTPSENLTKPLWTDINKAGFRINQKLLQSVA